MSRRGRIVVIVVVLACLFGAWVLDRSTSSGADDASAFVALGPRVPEASAENVAWYCAEGTSNPGGRADDRRAGRWPRRQRLGERGHRGARRVDGQKVGPDPAQRLQAAAVPVAEQRTVEPPTEAARPQAVGHGGRRHRIPVQYAFDGHPVEVAEPARGGHQHPYTLVTNVALVRDVLSIYR